MQTPLLVDGSTYVVIDDHNHTDLCWQVIVRWYTSLIPSNMRPKVWRSRINIVSLRHYQEIEEMVSSRGKKKEPVRSENGFIGFVNITLTEDEYALVDKEMSDKKVVSGMPGHIDYLLELGKVSINYVNGSVNVTLTVLEGEMIGYAVSAFSDSVIEAVLLVRLKVERYLPQFKEIYEKGGAKSRRG